MRHSKFTPPCTRTNGRASKETLAQRLIYIDHNFDDRWPEMSFLNFDAKYMRDFARFDTIWTI